MKSKKKKKKYYAGGSASPAEALGKMQRAKKGMTVGSYLEGGTIVYGDDKKKKKKDSVNKKSPIPGTISNANLDDFAKDLKKRVKAIQSAFRTPLIK